MTACSRSVTEERISPSKSNPGYWSYGGETVLLIGGWDHGHNPFLDHSTIDGGGYEDTSTEAEIIAALDLLEASGGNLIRCVLDPGVGAGRQGFPFCAKVGDKFDLDTMEGPYWERLEFFLDATQRRGIVVGLEIWDRFDWYDGGHQGWQGSPFNPRNNINYTVESSGLAESYEGELDNSQNPFGQTTPGQRYYRNADPELQAKLDMLRSYQEQFMLRLLEVTLPYGNVLYSANNEVRHQEPVWGEYWLEFIRKEAKRQGVAVVCTDMFWDILDIPDSPGFDHLLANTDTYDYFDVSQTSAHRGHQDLSVAEAGEVHWNKIRYAVGEGRKVNRILHMDKIYGSKDKVNGWMGSAENAVEEFWRSLIAGVAGVRFHRPDGGIGLSERARNSLRAVRLVEEKVKFWEVEARQDLLTDREPNEAYLAADPGQKYILFVPDGGKVGLQLDEHSATCFDITWVNVATGEVDSQEHLHGGEVFDIEAPGNGPWVAILVSASTS